MIVGAYWEAGFVGRAYVFSLPIVPVELAFFEASWRPAERAVILQWSTASEENNLGFHVERTTAVGVPYERLNREIIPGAGTSTTPHSYRFVDEGVEPGTNYYRLVQVDTDGKTTLHGPVTVMVGLGLPEVFGLEQATPNPFDESITIAYEIPTRAKVHLAVYDVQGRLVRVLVDGEQQPARHRAVWDGLDMAGARVAAGQYVCRFVAGEFIATQRLVLIR